MEACREALDKRTDKSITTEATMKMIQTVLENNIFSFNGKDYGIYSRQEQQLGVV